MQDILYRQFYRAPKKNKRFNSRSFLHDALVYTLMFVPVTFFAAFMMNDSLHEALYLTIPVVVGVILGQVFVGWYDMGLVWANSIMFACILIVVLVSLLIHPLLFGIALDPHNP